MSKPQSPAPSTGNVNSTGDGQPSVSQPSGSSTSYANSSAIAKAKVEAISTSVISKVEEIKSNVQNAITKKQETLTEDSKQVTATITAQIDTMKNTVENTLFKWKKEGDERVVWLLKEFQSIMNNIAKVKDSNVRNEYITLFSAKLNDVVTQYNQIQQKEAIQTIKDSTQKIQQYIANLFPHKNNVPNNKNNDPTNKSSDPTNKSSDPNNKNDYNSIIETQLHALLDSIKNGFEKINSLNDINVVKEYINILLNTITNVINIHPSKKKEKSDEKEDVQQQQQQQPQQQQQQASMLPQFIFNAIEKIKENSQNIFHQYASVNYQENTLRLLEELKQYLQALKDINDLDTLKEHVNNFVSKIYPSSTPQQPTIHSSESSQSSQLSSQSSSLLSNSQPKAENS